MAQAAELNLDGTTHELEGLFNTYEPDSLREEPWAECAFSEPIEPKDNKTFVDIMKKTLGNLLRSVQAGKHNVADHVLKYIEAHSEAEMGDAMEKSICDHTEDFVSGIENGFKETE